MTIITSQIETFILVLVLTSIAVACVISKQIRLLPQLCITSYHGFLSRNCPKCKFSKGKKMLQTDQKIKTQFVRWFIMIKSVNFLKAEGKKYYKWMKN